jgi:hypothetical protein
MTLKAEQSSPWIPEIQLILSSLFMVPQKSLPFFQPKFCIIFIYFHVFYISCQSFPSSADHPNNIKSGHKLWTSVTCKFLHPVTYYHWGPILWTLIVSYVIMKSILMLRKKSCVIALITWGLRIFWPSCDILIAKLMAYVWPHVTFEKL